MFDFLSRGVRRLTQSKLSFQRDWLVHSVFCSGNITLVCIFIVHVFLFFLFKKSCILSKYTLIKHCCSVWNICNLSFKGNSFGTAPNGQVCKGCGQQEQFYGCADIAISPATSGAHQAGSYHPYVPQGVVARPQFPVGGSTITCTATTAFRRISPWSADSWCVSNCRMGNCPPMYCNTPCQNLRVFG